MRGWADLVRPGTQSTSWALTDSALDDVLLGKGLRFTDRRMDESSRCGCKWRREGVSETRVHLAASHGIINRKQHVVGVFLCFCVMPAVLPASPMLAL